MCKAVFLTSLPLVVASVPCETRSETPESNQAAFLTPEAQKAELIKLQEILASVDALPAKGARWIEVQAGTGKEMEWHRGWLLRDSPSEIQVLDELGKKRTFDNRKHTAKKPDAAFQWRDVRDFRAGDFIAACRDLLADRKKKDADDSNVKDVYAFQRELDEADAAIVTAARFACWANVLGNKEIAPKLLQWAAKKLRERNAIYVGMSDGDDFARFVADRTSTQRPDDYDWDLEQKDTNVARRNMLTSSKAVAKIPYRSDHAEVMQRIRQRESLVAEDKVWKEPSKDALAKMDVKQKATYWLYHLRDLHVMQTDSPGTCIILPDYRWGAFENGHTKPKETLNTAEELRNLGYEALPQIIEHLDDDRPTECIGFWRNFAPYCYELAYGDCCQQIFEAIALRPIYEGGRYPIREGQGKHCKQTAQAWWSELQKKGEKQILIEATQRADDSSGANAQRLIAKYPEGAFEVVRDAIRSTNDSTARFFLINQLKKLKDDRVEPFLREEANRSMRQDIQSGRKDEKPVARK